MKRSLLWVVALVIAAAPVLSEVCRLDCERAHPPECPLHHEAPRPCAHDHTSAAARLTSAGADVLRPAPLAIAVEPYRSAASAETFADGFRATRGPAPPLRSPRFDVLRI
jgi:hypothetical protein